MKVKNLLAIVVISIIATIVAPDTSAQMANEPPSENCMSDSDILSINREYEASDNIKNYKTFVVDADHDGEYNAGFWLLPARYSDGNYTNFEVYVNGTPVGFIAPTKGNWQFATISEEPTIFLMEGENTISIATSAPEIPAVESIRIAENASDAIISSEAYDDFLTKAISGVNLDVEDIDDTEFASTSSTIVQPDFLWDMELRYTFYKKIEFTKGENIFITSNSEKQHLIDVMYCGEYKDVSEYPYIPDLPVNPPVRPTVVSNGNDAKVPSNTDGIDIGSFPVESIIFVEASSEEMQGMNYRASSTKLTGSQSQVATVKIASIPKTGVYLIRLRTTDNSVQGTANLQIGDKYFYEDCPISLSFRSTIMPADGTQYASMTKSFNSGVDNPIIFVHGNGADRIVGWNDDGPYNTLTKYNLHKYEAYISQIYKVKTSGISVSNRFSSRPVSKCDVITRMAVSSGQALQSINKTPGQKNIAGMMIVKEFPDNITIPHYAKLGESICLSANSKIQAVTVYDLAGNLIARQNVNSNKSNLALHNLGIINKGIYIITVESEDSVISRKLLVR